MKNEGLLCCYKLVVQTLRVSISCGCIWKVLSENDTRERNERM